MRKAKNKPTKKQSKNQAPKQARTSAQKLTFLEHIHELRKRLFYIAIAIGVGGGAAYGVQLHITDLLLRPAGNQQFIYTSPGGGFNFLFNLCLYAGILFAIPVMVYQLLRYLQPLMKQSVTRTIVWGSIASGILAMFGIAFGYFFGLPAAMKFLVGQFTTQQIEALLTIQSYMSFVMMYLLGSALLFQVPLVMLLINRVKPLKPRKLMGFQRWFIVLAFIIGAIINPSPNIQDQLMLSIPMILMYQVGIVLVWATNKRGSKARKVMELMRKDEEARAERLSKFQQAQETWLQAVQTTVKAPTPTRRPIEPLLPARHKPLVAAPQPVTKPVPSEPPAPSTIIRPTRPYASDIRRAPQPSYRSIAISVQE